LAQEATASAQASQSGTAESEFLDGSFTPSLYSGFTADSSGGVVQFRRDAMEPPASSSNFSRSLLDGDADSDELPDLFENVVNDSGDGNEQV
jgi:hypothetical protein